MVELFRAARAGRGGPPVGGDFCPQPAVRLSKTAEFWALGLYLTRVERQRSSPLDVDNLRVAPKPGSGKRGQGDLPSKWIYLCHFSELGYNTIIGFWHLNTEIATRTCYGGYALVCRLNRKLNNQQLYLSKRLLESWFGPAAGGEFHPIQGKTSVRWQPTFRPELPFTQVVVIREDLLGC